MVCVCVFMCENHEHAESASIMRVMLCYISTEEVSANPSLFVSSDRSLSDALLVAPLPCHH